MKIHDLTDDHSDGTEIDLSPGEIIQIQGNCSTDPLYRLFGAVTLLEDESYNKLESISEVKLDEQRKKLYNGKVGLKIEAGGCQFGMVVQEEDLWIDARREFLGPQEYTVLGRVEDEIDSESDGYWDLIDALRILGEVVPPKELEKQRDDLIDEVVKNVDLEIDIEEQLIESALLERLYSENVSFSDLGEERKKLDSALKTVQEGENADEGKFYTLHRILYPFKRVNDEEQGESTELNLEQHIDKDEMADEMTIDSGYVVSPIAIYW